MSEDEGEDIVQCVNCILQIQHLVRIKCCECDAILCVPCFRMGAETGDHRRGHNYEVVDVVGTTTFQFDGAWGSLEEASLLDAAHDFKMGNWADMVKQMGSLRTAQQASDYFDRVFIRGPVGQFALAGCQWLRSRPECLSGEDAEVLLKEECMSPLKYQLILQALRGLPASDVPSTSTSHLKEKLLHITKEFIDNTKEMDHDKSYPVAKQGWLLQKCLPEMEELDVSSDEDTEKGVVQQDLSNMFKSMNNISPGRLPVSEVLPTNGVIYESDEEEQSDNQSPFLPAKSMKRKFVRIQNPQVPDECNGHDDEHIGRSNGGMPIQDVTCRSSALQQFEFRKFNIATANLSADEVSVVHFNSVRENSSTKYTSSNGSSSNDDAMEIEDQVVEGNGSVVDGSEELGNSRSSLIFEEPPGDFEEVDPDQPSTSKCNGSTHTGNGHPSTSSATPSIRRKKKNALKSKKMRRLDAFEKKMNSKNKKKEIEEQELEEVCPVWEIKSLRDSYPALCLDVGYEHKERPKIRQDDLNFLGYCIDRDEFDHESFNEGETLISRLQCHLPEENSKTEFVNNNIKFARIQNYIRTLNKRNARRRAIIEHGKITEFFNFMKSMSMEKRSASDIMEDRSPIEKMKTVLQQTLTRDEHNRLFETVDRAEQLKQRILRLQELQRQGVTTLRGEDKERLSPKKTKRKENKAVKKRLNAKWSAFKRYHKNQFTNGLDE